MAVVAAVFARPPPAADAADVAAAREAAAKRAALARSNEIFQQARELNRDWEAHGEPQRVSAGFLAECDDVAAGAVARTFGEIWVATGSTLFFPSRWDSAM